MHQALDEVARPRLHVVGTVSSEDMSVYPVLAQLEDLDLLPGELGEPEGGNGLVKMADADELFLALKIANGMGILNTVPEILVKVGHEHQHAEAARALSLKAIHIVRFAKTERGFGMKVATMPVGETVSKLGFASILAHPRKLSRSDERKLSVIGYEGASDVADRIKDLGLDIPLPLSVQ